MERVIRAEYRDPGTDAAVTAWISGEGELPGLLDAIVMIHGGRGHPSLELTRPVGSSLMAATDGTRCARRDYSVAMSCLVDGRGVR